jgi:hypothetical protein
MHIRICGAPRGMSRRRHATATRPGLGRGSIVHRRRAIIVMRAAMARRLIIVTRAAMARRTMLAAIAGRHRARRRVMHRHAMIATRVATSPGSIARRRAIIMMRAVTVRRVIIVTRAGTGRRAMFAAIVGRRRAKPRVTRHRRATIATSDAMSRATIRATGHHRPVIIVTRAGTVRRPMLAAIVDRRRAISATAGQTTIAVRRGLTLAGLPARIAGHCCANMSGTRAGRARSNASLAATRPAARRPTATAIPTPGLIADS